MDSVCKKVPKFIWTSLPPTPQRVINDDFYAFRILFLCFYIRLCDKNLWFIRSPFHSFSVDLLHLSLDEASEIEQTAERKVLQMEKEI